MCAVSCTAADESMSSDRPKDATNGPQGLSAAPDSDALSCNATKPHATHVNVGDKRPLKGQDAVVVVNAAFISKQGKGKESQKGSAGQELPEQLDPEHAQQHPVQLQHKKLPQVAASMNAAGVASVSGLAASALGVASPLIGMHATSSPSLADTANADLALLAAAVAASKLGLADQLTSSIEACEAVVHARDAEGRTCLHYAAGYGHEECVDALLAKKSDACARDGNGDIPLHFAAIHGHPMCAYNITKMCPAACLLKNVRGQTPMDVAVACERGEVLNAMLLACAGDGGEVAVSAMRKLLSDGAVPDTWAPNGSSALMLAASIDGTEALKVLLENGASIELQDALGRSALMFAAGNCAVGTLEALLDAGASMAQRDRRGRCVLDYAPESSEVQKLLQRRLKALEEVAAQRQADLLASLETSSSTTTTSSSKVTNGISKKRSSKKANKPAKSSELKPKDPPAAAATMTSSPAAFQSAKTGIGPRMASAQTSCSKAHSMAQDLVPSMKGLQSICKIAASKQAASGADSATSSPVQPLHASHQVDNSTHAAGECAGSCSSASGSALDSSAVLVSAGTAQPNEATDSQPPVEQWTDPAADDWQVVETKGHHHRKGSSTAQPSRLLPAGNSSVTRLAGQALVPSEPESNPANHQPGVPTRSRTAHLRATAPSAGSPPRHPRFSHQHGTGTEATHQVPASAPQSRHKRQVSNHSISSLGSCDSHPTTARSSSRPNTPAANAWQHRLFVSSSSAMSSPRNSTPSPPPQRVSTKTAPPQQQQQQQPLQPQEGCSWARKLSLAVHAPSTAAPQVEASSVPTPDQSIQDGSTSKQSSSVKLQCLAPAAAGAPASATATKSLLASAKATTAGCTASSALGSSLASSCSAPPTRPSVDAAIVADNKLSPAVAAMDLNRASVIVGSAPAEGSCYSSSLAPSMDKLIVEAEVIAPKPASATAVGLLQLRHENEMLRRRLKQAQASHAAELAAVLEDAAQHEEQAVKAAVHQERLRFVSQLLAMGMNPQTIMSLLLPVASSSELCPGPMPPVSLGGSMAVAASTACYHQQAPQQSLQQAMPGELKSGLPIAADAVSGPMQLPQHTNGASTSSTSSQLLQVRADNMCQQHVQQHQHPQHQHQQLHCLLMAHHNKAALGSPSTAEKPRALPTVLATGPMQPIARQTSNAALQQQMAECALQELHRQSFNSQGSSQTEEEQEDWGLDVLPACGDISAALAMSDDEEDLAVDADAASGAVTGAALANRDPDASAGDKLGAGAMGMTRQASRPVTIPTISSTALSCTAAGCSSVAATALEGLPLANPEPCGKPATPQGSLSKSFTALAAVHHGSHANSSLSSSFGHFGSPGLFGSSPGCFSASPIGPAKPALRQQQQQQPVQLAGSVQRSSPTAATTSASQHFSLFDAGLGLRSEFVGNRCAFVVPAKQEPSSIMPSTVAKHGFDVPAPPASEGAGQAGITALGGDVVKQAAGIVVQGLGFGAASQLVKMSAVRQLSPNGPLDQLPEYL